ncbi:MAG TPA: SIMPL domain-containing protein [Anaerolineales bacterium]|nr:SIMPL domain-containing protein [Anaerolineales bacterium]
MKQIFKVIPLLIVAAIALTACGTTVLPEQMAIGNVQTEQSAKTIRVSAGGSVNAAPDVAYIYIGIHTENENAATAVSENNTKVQKLMETLKTAGVAEVDMQTSNFSIWQNQQYNYDGSSSGSVYMVDNTVYVTVRNLDSLGDTLNSAVQAGANNINSIQFGLADNSTKTSEARSLAVVNATKIAQELAAASGVELGEIESISYYSNEYPVTFYGAGGMGGGGAESSVPITTGQISVQATVEITFRIK